MKPIFTNFVKLLQNYRSNFYIVKLKVFGVCFGKGFFIMAQLMACKNLIYYDAKYNHIFLLCGKSVYSEIGFMGIIPKKAIENHVRSGRYFLVGEL